MTEAGSRGDGGSGVEDGYVTLGLVSRAHGVHGAVIVRPLTENFTLPDGAGLELWSPDGRERRPAENLKGRPAEQGLIIKFPGLTTREEAAALKGWRLVLPRALLPPLPDDEIYWADLVGLVVSTRAGLVLGRVEHLMDAGAGLLLAVVDAAGVERLIPFQPALVSDLDPAGGRLVIDPPPGLLDL